MSSYSSASSSESEGRVSISEVPDQISRIFFGDPKPSYNSPSSSYAHPPVGGSGYYPGGVGAVAPYPGYYDDVELLVKLGQAALIVFIIFAIVAIIFMLVLACLYCIYGSRSSNDRYPASSGVQPRSAAVANEKTAYPKPAFSSFSSTNPPSIDPPPASITPTNAKQKTRRKHRQPLEDSDDESDGPSRRRGLFKQPGRSNLNELTSTSSVSSVHYPEDETQPKRKESFFMETGHSPRPPAPAPTASDAPSPSSATGDTVVSRRPRDLPPVPPPSAAQNAAAASASLATPRPAVSMTSSSNSSSSNNRFRRSRSHTSEDTAVSLPRSIPYYEVPAPRAYSIRRAEHVRGGDSSIPPPPPNALAPPPRPPSSSLTAVGPSSVAAGATQTTATGATAAPMSAAVQARRPPFSYLEQQMMMEEEKTVASRKTSSVHSRLV